MIHKSRLMLWCLSASIISLWTSAVTAAELELAGIRLGRPATTVIQKYGNPTEVKVGATGQVQIVSPTATPTQPSPSTTYPTAPSSTFPTTPTTTLPTMPGAPLTQPFGTSPFPTATPTQPSASTTQVVQKATAPEVTWVYQFPNNRTLDFVISPDGRVVEIRAFGVEWPSIRTSKGITLGQTYKDVILKYGFPEQHERSGAQLIAKYPEKHRALFTFVGKTLVGITIALMD
jgi:hypothetical protein